MFSQPCCWVIWFIVSKSYQQFFKNIVSCFLSFSFDLIWPGLLNGIFLSLFNSKSSYLSFLLRALEMKDRREELFLCFGPVLPFLSNTVPDKWCDDPVDFPFLRPVPCVKCLNKCLKKCLITFEISSIELSIGRSAVSFQSLKRTTTTTKSKDIKASFLYSLEGQCDNLSIFLYEWTQTQTCRVELKGWGKLDVCLLFAWCQDDSDSPYS